MPKDQCRKGKERALLPAEKKEESTCILGLVILTTSRGRGTTTCSICNRP